jgi:hypothetical protein
MKVTKGKSIAGIIIGLLLFSAVFVFIGIRDRDFANRCQAVPGEAVNVVQKTRIEKSSDLVNRHNKTVSYSVTYTYTLNGQEYKDKETTSDNVELGPIVVFVDPARPSKSRLEKPSPYLDFLVAFVALAGAIFIGYEALRWKKRAPEAPSSANSANTQPPA